MSANAVYYTLYKLLDFWKKYDVCYVESDIITDINKNFSFLECDSSHTATSNKDTFYINKKYILRTHTTNFQHDFMHKYVAKINLHETVNGINYGMVFRKDDSSRHSYFFHQIDGLLFNNKFSIFNYLNLIKNSIRYVLNNNNIQFRIRKSYFPFTYPSYEVDLFINNTYTEILGCGVVHEKILTKCGILSVDSFAFGMGIERIASFIYKEFNIKQLRLL